MLAYDTLTTGELDGLSVSGFLNLPLEPSGDDNMSLDLTGLQNHFKTAGKYIFLALQSDDNAEAMKKAVLGADAQNADADADLFPRLKEVFVPFYNQTNAAINSVEAVRTYAKTAVQNLLQNVIAVDLGLSRGSSVATVGTALVASMVANSGKVTASGSSPDGFSAYFGSNFSITLPTGVANIPDSYIDDDVV